MDEGKVDLVAPLGSCDGTPQQLCQLVLDQVVTYPETHNQRDWECGTQACVAGWTLLFSRGFVYGGIPRSSPAIAAAAREALGLSVDDAARLFFCTTEEQAKLALKALANGETVDWDAVGHKFHNDRGLAATLDSVLLSGIA